jgi:hypothetical protein
MAIDLESDLSKPVNHVFVDFENVHEIDVSVIADETVHFTLMVDPQKKKLDIDVVEKMMERADSVQLLRLSWVTRRATAKRARPGRSWSFFAKTEIS